MDDRQERKSFSEASHEGGQWRTRTAGRTNFVSRALWNFISYKRAGVDTLARQCSPGWRVVDCGAGNGAYSNWFLQRCPCTVIALDWSMRALREMPSSAGGKLLRVCADVEMMPIKSGSCDALFTIDTLGHVRSQVNVFDEMLRVLKADSPVFLHSECGDYMMRWPDRMIRRRLGYDSLASLDGHISLPQHNDLHRTLLQRFEIASFFSPAGLLGWIFGYPEKYAFAFREARYRILCGITWCFILIKRAPVLGLVLRIVNSLSNRLELYLGIEGGGSCFAVLRTPDRKDTETVTSG